MRRRDFITLFGVVAAAWPFAARAQQPAKMPCVGLVSAQSRSAPNNAAFDKRLAELGYQDGKDFIFDFVQVASLEAWETAFQGLGARKVDIMVAAGPEIAVKTALATSDTIPIVMIAIDYDPFARGYVTSLARPSGNITGIFLRQIGEPLSTDQCCSVVAETCGERECRRLPPGDYADAQNHL